MKEEVLLRKARKIAAWSYVGLLSPLVGWVLGGISKSLVNGLEAPTSVLARDHRASIKTIANVGIWLSTVAALAYVVLGVWANVLVRQQISDAEAKTTEAAQQVQLQQTAADSLGFKKESHQRALSGCLDRVTEWFNQNYANVTTVYQEQNLLTSKQQQIQECQLRYPVD